MGTMAEPLYPSPDLHYSPSLLSHRERGDLCHNLLNPGRLGDLEWKREAPQGADPQD